MNLAAIAFAIIGILLLCLSFFGVSPDGADLAILGLVCYGVVLLCMNLPAVWGRRVP